MLVQIPGDRGAGGQPACRCSLCGQRPERVEPSVFLCRHQVVQQAGTPLVGITEHTGTFPARAAIDDDLDAIGTELVPVWADSPVRFGRGICLERLGCAGGCSPAAHDRGTRSARRTTRVDGTGGRSSGCRNRITMMPNARPSLSIQSPAAGPGSVAETTNR